MSLQCLIVTSDCHLIGQLRTSMQAQNCVLDLRQDSETAIELASRRHFDGVLIDCDDVPGGREAIAQIRNSRSNRQTQLIAVANGSTSVEAALDLGANFVLCKPIQETRLRQFLEVAVPKMEREHRRYFRYHADLPVQIRNHDGKTFTARMQNVSEGGLAIKLPLNLRLEGVVNVDFEIPSVYPQTFRSKADVVWSDSFVVGLRFLHVERDSEGALRDWLSSVEAQQQLRG
jgi:DNA-binding response OmpR family regulator